MKKRPKLWCEAEKQDHREMPGKIDQLKIEAAVPQLLFLLMSQHWQGLFTEGAFAARAYIKPLAITIVQFIRREIQVTDTAARGIGLAGNLAVILE